MTLRRFEKLDITNPEIKSLQYRLEETFQPITDSPVLGGRLIEDIDQYIHLTASGTTTVTVWVF